MYEEERGGKGAAQRDTMDGSTDKRLHTQAQIEASVGPSRDKKLMTSLFLLPAGGIYTAPTAVPHSENGRLMMAPF